MLQSRKNWRWKLELATCLTISGSIIALSGNHTLAQSNIVPDSTLGAESSTVTPLNSDFPTNEIRGGAIRGTNLFHSFLEFNVSEGQAAYFLSPNTGIQNILARVTGGSPSEIMGILGTRGGSSPNLFLINPNSIIFGPKASLDVGGSFVASTASSLKFSDGTEFNATEPQTPLLTVSVPIGLQFGRDVGRILNQSVAVDSSGLLPVGLQVQPGKTLALVGGDVLLEGANLTAEAGRIELGSVAGLSLVSLTPTAQGWVLGYEGVENFKDIQLSQTAFVYAGGEGSDIQVQGRRVTLTDGSQIAAFSRELQGGTLVVNASDSVKLTGFTTTPYVQIPTGLRTDAGGSGPAGNLTINTRQLIVKDGAVVSAGTGTSTRSTGQGGNLTVNASDSVELSGAIITPDGQFISGLFAQTQGTGDAGNLTINTGKLIVQDGAVVSAGTSTGSTGQGGNLTVTASDFVELSGAVITPDGQFISGLFAQTQGTGDARNLTINTGKLIVQDGAVVSAGTSTGSTGQGGNLTVTASDFVELSGTSEDGEITSGLFARTRGTGSAGNLRIATGQLIVRDRAQVTVSGVESGEAGNLEVTARSMRLKNQGAIVAETASAQGGNITLQVQDLLLMRNNSLISTTAGTAGGGGNGGNININTDLLIALENSDITANAFTGNGGNVKINTQKILRSPDSEITASSTLGVDGVVEIDTPDVDPVQGLATLPAELVDVSGLIAQSCLGGGGTVGRGASEFIITGRGGLPPSPSEALRSDAVRVDLRASTVPVAKQSGVASAPQSPRPTAVPLVEAQGWVTNDKGEVILTATAPTVTPHSPWLTTAACHSPKNSS